MFYLKLKSREEQGEGGEVNHACGLWTLPPTASFLPECCPWLPAILKSVLKSLSLVKGAEQRQSIACEITTMAL